MVTLAAFAATLSACSLDNRHLELAVGGSGSGQSGAGGNVQAGGGSGGVAGHAAGSGGVAGAAPAIPEVEGCADLDANKVPDCNETIALNSDFKMDALLWSADMYTSVIWNEENAAGDPPSGSALVVSEGVIDENGIGVALRSAQQCIAIDGAKLVLVYANAFVDAGQDEQGRAEVDVAFFDSEDCSGALSTSFSTPQPLDGGVGSWFTLKAGSVSSASTKSAQVKLGLLKPFRAKSFQARFDNVLVKTENAQP